MLVVGLHELVLNVAVVQQHAMIRLSLPIFIEVLPQVLIATDNFSTTSRKQSKLRVQYHTIATV